MDILGHIFEQSIKDLERLRDELEGRVEPLTPERRILRRRKEGAFYSSLSWSGKPAPSMVVVIYDAGTVGDSFGAVNALFSGLALAGVVVAILLQSEDLRAQSTALSPSSRNCARL